jgi:multiple sugar transport system substrate-binding protein
MKMQAFSRSRSAAALAGVAVLSLALAGCSGSTNTASSGGKTTITFSYLWGGPEGAALQKIIGQFNSSQTKIVVKGVSNPDMQKQLASMSSSSGSFDVSDNFGNSVGTWASKGVLTPLDALLKTAGADTGDFVPAAMNQMRYQGKIYALPIALHTMQLVYNKKLLQAAGVRPPTTTDELATAIAKLTKVDAAGNITQLGLGNPDLSTSLTTLGYAFGGTWDGPNASAPTPTPAEQGNLAAIKFWQDNLTNKYGVDKVAKFTAGWGQYMSPQDPFYTGKVAMVIEGEWQAVSIPKTAPNLQWGVASIPVANASLDGTTQLTASTLFIPANSQHKAQAATFLKYMTGKQAMLDFTMALGNLPARTSLLADPKYAAIPQMSAWLDSLKSPNVQALASTPYSAQYATDLASAFLTAARGTTTPQQAMQKVSNQAKSYSTK